jgi:hypothetical protein
MHVPGASRVRTSAERAEGYWLAPARERTRPLSGLLDHPVRFAETPSDAPCDRQPPVTMGAVSGGRIRTTWKVDVTGARWAGASMVGLGLVLPHLPHNPGLPCPLRTLTGVPCPLCGMTTAVKAVCTGHVRTSIAANPFGVVAVAVAVALLMRPGVRSVRVPVMVVVAAAITSWVWELHRFGLV